MASAQSAPIDPKRAQATRAELEDLLARAPANAQNSPDVVALRERLTEGDFQGGDRIVLRVLEDSTLSDTFTVRPGRTLSLASLPEISLRGVLRSELEAFLTAQVGRFLRNPTVTAVSLVRIAVFGEVIRPGFYHVPADVLLSDVMMIAGGPTGNADTRKTFVRRGSEELMDREATRRALLAGRSLDQLNLHGGDEIVIGGRGGGVMSALQVAGMISGALFGVVALTQIFK